MANRDWLPKSRTEQLAIADDWIAMCAANQITWGILGVALTELIAFRDAVRTAMEIVQNETSRTLVTTAKCKEAFDTLTDFMRDFKRWYFLTPPLRPSGLISLGLNPHDEHPTPSTTPTAQVTQETYLVGRHELERVRSVYVTGNFDDPANTGYRIWYSVIAPGETPLVNPEELRKSFYAQRRKDLGQKACDFLSEFEFGDGGSMAYLAVQVENDGKKGNWGPLVSALIP
jgi:hypothetical protein